MKTETSSEGKEKADAIEAKKQKYKESRLMDSRGVVRISSTDIPGEADVYHGLTYIKGISWSISNAICHTLKIERKRKINTLIESEIGEITNFIKKPNIPRFLLNRVNDPFTGEDKHLITTELELQRDFDIRNMKKIHSYKGLRHALGQPVRGQRTKSHFRKGRAIGVQRAKVKPATSPAAKAKSKEKKE